MSVFDGIKQILDNLFSVSSDVWVRRKNISHENLQTCNGEAHPDATTNTCELCVALNETVFKNNNKPDYYHSNCKCQNTKYNLADVVMDFPIRKITAYLFVNVNKKAMMKTMGYDINKAYSLYMIIYNAVKNNFLSGNYELGLLNKNGQHFAIRFKLNGINDHIGEQFNCHVGCVS